MQIQSLNNCNGNRKNTWANTWWDTKLLEKRGIKYKNRNFARSFIRFLFKRFINKAFPNDFVVAEKKLMRMNEVWEAKMSTDMIIDDLGEITLDTGTCKLELSAKDGIKSGELFRPRAVILNPR